MQVTTRSALGGLLVDDGWLRILGGRTDQLVDLATIDGLDDPNEQVGPRGHLVVGQDVLGGYFAINGGDLPADPGEIAYWGPDTSTGLRSAPAIVRYRTEGGRSSNTPRASWFDELSGMVPQVTVDGSDSSAAFRFSRLSSICGRMSRCWGSMTPYRLRNSGSGRTVIS